MQLPLTYPSGVALDKNKLKDLKDLEKFIPKEHRAFYKELFAKQDNISIKSEDGSSDEDQDCDFLDF